jgi:hypothetical protein
VSDVVRGATAGVIQGAMGGGGGAPMTTVTMTNPGTAPPRTVAGGTTTTTVVTRSGGGSGTPGSGFGVGPVANNIPRTGGQTPPAAAAPVDDVVSTSGSCGSCLRNYNLRVKMTGNCKRNLCLWYKEANTGEPVNSCWCVFFALLASRRVSFAVRACSPWPVQPATTAAETAVYLSR